MELHLILLLSFVTTCFSNDYYFPRRSKTSFPPENSIVRFSNQFGFDLLRTVHKSQNAFLSPLSISLTVGMVYLGARNETAQEIRRVMDYPPNVHSSFQSIMQLLKPSQEARKTPKQDGYRLEMANAMLVEKSFNLLQSYKDECRKYYDAAVESVSFSIHPEAAVESVNGWVAWRTNNKISKVLQEPLDSLTKLFLLNAVYFKGTWKTRFDQRLTMPDTFYNEGRIPKTVPMMRQKKKFLYGFDSRIDGHVLELPYLGEDIRMLLLLPDKRDGLPDLEASLTDSLLQDIASSSTREVTAQVTLPRFSLSEEYDLIHLLKKMGITSVFSATKADLSGITTTEGLHVTKMIHKGVIDVNEEGSEAAAVTGVSAGVRTGGPLVPLFTADHPFLFFVRDARINATLFIGRVTTL